MNMVALLNSPYPTATFISDKVRIRARIPAIRCSIRVSARRVRRKNYLRPKIVKTLTKPYPTLVPNPTPEHVRITIEPMLEESEDSVVGDLETVVGSGEGDLREVELVREVKGSNVANLKWVSSRMVVRVVASFVGLFVLETVVSAWLMGSTDFDEKDKSLRMEGRYGKGVGVNGEGFVGDLSFMNVDEAKIDEIRKMAREVREAEKKKKSLENGKVGVGVDVDDVDAEDDGEGVVSDSPGISLMFEKKRQFRSVLATLAGKPKGFQNNDIVREKRSTDGDQAERTDTGRRNDSKEPVSQSSTPLQASTSRSGSNRAGKKLGRRVNGPTTSGNDSTSETLSNRMDNGSTPEKGIVQEHSIKNNLDQGTKSEELSLIGDPQRKINNLSSSAMSNNHMMPRRTGLPDLKDRKSKLSLSSDQEKKHNGDVDVWWSTLPYVCVILMQKSHGREVQQGFYTLRSNSDQPDAESLSSYTIAFEDQNDARNFSYILDSEFGDLPDAAVDVALLSSEELKEIYESLDKKVIVARKGELKLYAGQPLADAEAALRSLMK